MATRKFMWHKSWAIAGIAAVAAGLLPTPSLAQSARPSEATIDVQSYRIDAEVDPEAGVLRATANVEFTPSAETSQVGFQLNNALELQRVEDTIGSSVSAQRMEIDHSVRLLAANPFPRGQVSTLKFTYAGRISGNEESPVWGIKFAAIKPEASFLLYPARWFPVSGYTTDRFSMDLQVTVPAGYHVVGSGTESTEMTSDGRNIVSFHMTEASFPGSFAVLRGDPQVYTAGSSRITFYAREVKEVAGAYATEIGRAIEYFSGVLGPLGSPNLTVVETESGAPNGYAAPGILFLSPGGMGNEVRPRLVANQVARQWFGVMVSPATRNHLWLQNGLARYAEIMYAQETEGAAARNALLHETYVEALTVENPPMMQAARLEDYSPEYWALTAGKGAAVLNMLRDQVGEEKFTQILRTVLDRYKWQSITTEQFQAVAEQVSEENLTGFFLQWAESSGAPEFQLEYTTFRTRNGFRVNGKITQDLDLFRMPVKLRIDTEGNPEVKTVIVSGPSSDFAVETFGKPVNVVIDPQGDVLRYDDDMRVAVAIRRGEQFVEIAEYLDAIKEYEKALQVKRNSSLALYRVGEVFFLQNNLQEAANRFRAALQGDLEPAWVEVWAHINLGKIFDITGDRARATNEYRQAVRTKDNTQGALEEAEKYLQTPYERERPQF